MWSTTKNNKCCATCANWGGERKATFSKSVETKEGSTRGKCCAGIPADASQGPTACGHNNCPKYQLWGALK